MVDFPIFNSSPLNTSLDLTNLPFLKIEEKAFLNRCNPYLKNAFMSAFPWDKNGSNAHKIYEILHRKGVKNIFSLIPETEMRSEGFKSCELMAQSMNPSLQFNRFPICDFTVADDESVRNFIQERLIPLTKNSHEAILVHCHGGNGRSSTIAVLHTSMQLQISFDEAIKYVFACYLTRRDPLSYIPETEEQFKQMQRLCAGHPSKMTFQEWMNIAKGIVRAMRARE